MRPRLGRRRAFGYAAGLAALATPTILRASPDRPRIYMMLYRGWEDACDGFRDYLRSRGIDAELIIRNADESVARVPAMVAEAKAMRPDLVYVWGTSTTRAALGRWDEPDPATYLDDIPAVFNIVIDPVGNQIVPALDHPGRNATGTLYVVPIDIQLRSIASYKPFKRIGITYNPLERNSVLTADHLREALPKFGAELVAAPVGLDAKGAPDAGTLADRVHELAAQRCDWLYIAPDTFLQLYRAVLMDTALAAGLPTFTSTEPFIRGANGLFGLVCRYYSVGQFTARKAEQILREKMRPADIPIEALNRFSLLVNMKVARQLDLYPPMSMLRVLETV